jgi:transcriptional regulator with XRE-family HTH domain
MSRIPNDGMILGIVGGALGMNNRELADSLGISSAYLGQIKNGHHRISRKTARRLCRLIRKFLGESDSTLPWFLAVRHSLRSIARYLNSVDGVQGRQT